MHTKKLPQKVYVQWAGKGPSEPYLIASQTEAGAIRADNNGKRVGIYELVEVVNITSKTTYCCNRVKN